MIRIAGRDGDARFGRSQSDVGDPFSVQPQLEQASARSGKNGKRATAAMAARVGRAWEKENMGNCLQGNAGAGRPGKGWIVTYRNGDRLDLRRRNLEVTRGNAKGATVRGEQMALAA